MNSTFRDAVKLTALVFMVIDHLAVFMMRPLLLNMGTAPNEFYPYLLFRGLGRIAFPMFAFAFAMSIYEVRRNYSDPLARSEVYFRRARLMVGPFFIACLVHGFCLAISGQGANLWLESLTSLHFEKLFLGFLPVNILGAFTLSYLAIGTLYSMWGWPLRSIIIALICTGALAVDFQWFGLFLPVAFFSGFLALDSVILAVGSMSSVKHRASADLTSLFGLAETRSLIESFFWLVISLLGIGAVFVLFGGASNNNQLALLSLPLIFALWFYSMEKSQRFIHLNPQVQMKRKRLVSNPKFFINFYVYHPIFFIGLYCFFSQLD